MNQITDNGSFALLAADAGFDPIEERLRANVRATIEAVFEEELDSFLGRLRYGRSDGQSDKIITAHVDAGEYTPAILLTYQGSDAVSQTKALSYLARKLAVQEFAGD